MRVGWRSRWPTVRSSRAEASGATPAASPPAATVTLTVSADAGPPHGGCWPRWSAGWPSCSRWRRSALSGGPRQPPWPRAGGDADPGRLLDAIAVLDARYEGRADRDDAGGVGALSRGAIGAQDARWSALLRLVGTVPTFDPVEQSKYANGDARKPVKHRRGPATVTGTTSDVDLRSQRHWVTGKASEGPKPGDLSVRATMHTLGGGSVACRRRARRRCIARPPPRETGDFYFRTSSLPPRLRGAPARPRRLSRVRAGRTERRHRGRCRRHGRGLRSRTPHRLAHPGHHRAALRHRSRLRRSSAEPSGATILPPPPPCPTWATASPRTSRRCSRAIRISCCSTTRRRTPRSRPGSDRSGIPALRLNTDRARGRGPDRPPARPC